MAETTSLVDVCAVFVQDTMNFPHSSVVTMFWICAWLPAGIKTQQCSTEGKKPH